MAIRYHVKKQKARLNGQQKEIYLAAIHRDQGISTEELCTMIEKRTSLTKSDVRAVLENLGEIISESVANGRTIYLDMLGILSVNVRSKASANAEDFKSEDIRGIRLNFRPSTKLKRAMGNVHYEHVPESKEPSSSSSETNSPQP